MKFGNLLAFLIFMLAVALGSAKFAEIVLKIPPCKLCYYQRYIYVALIVLCSISFLKGYHFIKLIFILSLLATSSTLAFYHFGVENKWFHYDSECTNNFRQASSFIEFKKMLKDKELVSCDQSLFEFLGISMSGWNFIYSSLLLIITLTISLKYNWFKDEETKTPTTT